MPCSLTIWINVDNYGLHCFEAVIGGQASPVGSLQKNKREILSMSVLKCLLDY